MQLLACAQLAVLIAGPPQCMDEVQRGFGPLRDTVALLQSHGIALEGALVANEDIAVFLENAPVRWDATVHRAFKKKEEIQPLQNQMADAVKADIARFHEKVRCAHGWCGRRCLAPRAARHASCAAPLLFCRCAECGRSTRRARLSTLQDHQMKRTAAWTGELLANVMRRLRWLTGWLAGSTCRLLQWSGRQMASRSWRTCLSSQCAAVAAAARSTLAAHALYNCSHPASPPSETRAARCSS